MLTRGKDRPRRVFRPPRLRELREVPVKGEGDERTRIFHGGVLPGASIRLMQKFTMSVGLSCWVQASNAPSMREPEPEIVIDGLYGDSLALGCERGQMTCAE